MSESPSSRFFKTPAMLHRWFSRHHDKEQVLWIGFYKKGTGLPSITYPEALDEALCWGWIDGLKKRVDDLSYVQRFTPRKPRSIWSKVNIAKVEALEAAGRMQPAGRAAFAQRTPERSGVYAFEQEQAPVFSPAHLRTFKAAKSAWAFFAQQGAYYQRVATHWVESAKREDTRERRFTKLLHHSERGEKLPEFLPTRKT